MHYPCVMLSEAKHPYNCQGTLGPVGIPRYRSE